MKLSAEEKKRAGAPVCLGAALEYAAAGLPVLVLWWPIWTADGVRCACKNPKCASVGKHPITQHGLKDATTDQDQVRKWFKRWPDANLGILTDGLFVADADPRHGGDESLAQLVAGHGPLVTRRQLTGLFEGKRGEHLIFRQNGTAVRNGKIAQGLDRKADGGYIVAAPSLHASGVRYEMDDHPIEPVPGWLETLANDPGEATRPTLADLLAKPPKGPDSGRNDWLTRVAGHLARTHRDDRGAYEAGCWDAYELVDPQSFPKTEAEKTVDSIWGREQAKPRRPVIDASGPAHRPAKEAWDLLTSANDPPWLFRSGGVPSRLETGDDGQPQLVLLTQSRMAFELASIVQWQKANPKGELFECDPPTPVVQRVLATPDLPLPVLERLVGAPIFAADGSLHSKPGYHPGTRCLFVAAPGFVVPEPPPNPSQAEVSEAKRRFDELVCDFPFANDSAKAHALALFLLPFCRELIPGPTPLHLFDKPAPGTGAGLLTEVLLVPALGFPPPSMTECRDEDEWRKRITAKFASGAAVVLLDNLTGRLHSAALSAALTQPVWEDRILGHTQVGRWRVRCIWAATANNLQLDTDLARRTVRIRLDARLDRPWLRTGFRHNLPSYAYQQRPELVWAALTMVQAWLRADRPTGTQVLGTYESWAGTLGGILDVLRVPGFLGDLEQMWEDADSDMAARLWLVQRWYEASRFTGVPVSSLARLCEADLDCPLDLGDKATQHGTRTRLGQVLAAMRDQHYTLEDGVVVRVERGHKSHGNFLWRLVGQEPLPLGGGSPL